MTEDSFWSPPGGQQRRVTTESCQPHDQRAISAADGTGVPALITLTELSASAVQARAIGPSNGAPEGNP